MAGRWRQSRSLWLAVAAALLVLAGVCAGSIIGQIASDAVRPDAVGEQVVPPEEPAPKVGEEPVPLTGLARPKAPLPFGVASMGAELHRQFHEYVVGRVVRLTFPQREPLRFDGWDAYDDFEATEASSEGLLTQWDPGWYITHEWSWYGQRILGLIPGDVVCVNGEDILVQGAFDYPKESYNSEINEVVDTRYVVLQTCEPNSDLNRIVYGTPLEN